MTVLWSASVLWQGEKPNKDDLKEADILSKLSRAHASVSTSEEVYFCLYCAGFARFWGPGFSSIAFLPVIQTSLANCTSQQLSSGYYVAGGHYV